LSLPKGSAEAKPQHLCLGVKGLTNRGKYQLFPQDWLMDSFSLVDIAPLKAVLA
jgi:hypothetical protein